VAEERSPGVRSIESLVQLVEVAMLAEPVHRWSAPQERRRVLFGVRLKGDVRITAEHTSVRWARKLSEGFESMERSKLCLALAT
jgi:hypothetical protein